MMTGTNATCIPAETSTLHGSCSTLTVVSRFRLMTYNVHRCVGRGGRDSIGEIASLCAEAQADIIAMQELDAPETDEDEGIHHARDLASELEMTLLFCRTFRRGVGYYGHALLSRTPLE